MKKLFLLYVLLLSTSAFAQSSRQGSIPASPTAKSMLAGSFIDVNTPAYPQSSFSVQQLIENVLISGGANCAASVTNVVVSPGLSATNPSRSWGYFNKGTTAFPFNEGLVLMTGQASQAGNSFIPGNLSGTLNTLGDADLAAAIGVPNSNLRDATFI